MKILFTKMHGLGNDFMVIDGIHQSITPDPKLIAAWADRHFGIGFDQLLLVEPPSNAEALFKYRIFNADGGEVDQCGNGARCFARFVREKGLTDAKVIPVETNTGRLELKMIDDEHVTVNMGIPEFEPHKIPLNTSQRQHTYELSLGDRKLTFSALSMGNPHAVFQVEKLDDMTVHQLGPLIESHPLFPQRVNAGFMQVTGRDAFNLRVYERGAGETLACGSGACAAMVAGVQLGLLDHQATARVQGGHLQLDWPGEGKPVMMTGSTAVVYEGEINV